MDWRKPFGVKWPDVIGVTIIFSMIGGVALSRYIDWRSAEKSSQTINPNHGSYGHYTPYDREGRE